MVGDVDLHHDVVRGGLGVGDVHRPVPVLIEGPGVEQFQFGVLQAPAVMDEFVIGERGLRVVVAPLQVRVAGQAIQVPEVLLHILAVVALRSGQAEHALLEDGVLPVPQAQAKA